MNPPVHIGIAINPLFYVYMFIPYVLFAVYSSHVLKVPPKRRYFYTTPHCVTSHKMVVVIVTVLRTWDLASVINLRKQTVKYARSLSALFN